MAGYSSFHVACLGVVYGAAIVTALHGDEAYLAQFLLPFCLSLFFLCDNYSSSSSYYYYYYYCCYYYC